MLDFAYINLSVQLTTHAPPEFVDVPGKVAARSKHVGRDAYVQQRPLASEPAFLEGHCVRDLPTANLRMIVHQDSYVQPTVVAAGMFASVMAVALGVSRNKLPTRERRQWEIRVPSSMIPSNMTQKTTISHGVKKS